MSIICRFPPGCSKFLLSISLIDYVPVYFQACQASSPLRAGVQILPTALIMAPFSFIGGVMIKVIRKYMPSNILGWLLIVIGFGLMSLLKANSSTGQWVGYQIISSAGTGLIVSTLSTHRLSYRSSERDNSVAVLIGHVPSVGTSTRGTCCTSNRILVLSSCFLSGTSQFA